jgi:EmrB/QacA subfamily drug resistance transporter
MRDRFLALRPSAQRLVLAATFGAAFLGLLDATIIGTALPRVVEQLHGDETLYTWLVTGYLLAATVTTPLYGRYSDLAGRRPALLASLGLFLLGSLLCGIATSLPMLIACRTLQGLGAGGLLPVAMSLAREAFPMTMIGRLQAAMGTMIAVSLVGGPWVGGVLTDVFGWRSVFLINLILVPPIIAVVWRLVPRYRDPAAPAVRLDLLGTPLLLGGISLLLFGLTQKGRTSDGHSMYGWNHPAVAGCLTAGLVLLVALVFAERRAAVPIIPPSLFHNRNYSAVLAASAFFSVAMFPAVLFMPLYFQQVRGVSASISALLLTPLLIGMVVSNRYSVPLMWRPRGGRIVLAVAAVSLGLGAALVFTVNGHTPVVLICAYLALIGVGIGPSMAGVGLLAQNCVGPSDIGSATATLMLSKTAGHMVGLAISQTVFSYLLLRWSGTQGEIHATGDALTWTVGAVSLGGAVLAGLAVLRMREITIRDPRALRPQPTTSPGPR